MAVRSALLRSEHRRVALAISRLEGRAREWALACGTSVDAAFPTWDQLKQQLSRVFAPPNQAYRIRSKLLATRQGKKELLDYVQELRMLTAGMAADPLPELVSVTVFMEGLRVSAARTEVFRVHSNAFEEVVNVALNAEHNFRSARPGWSAGSARSSSGPEPMDLSYAEDEEAEFLAAEQRAGIRRCFVCSSSKHVRAYCPLRKKREAPASQPSGSDLHEWCNDIPEVSNVTSGEALRDCCDQLYTVVNGMTGEIEGDISLDTLPAVDALLELDEMSVAEFGEVLKAGDLAEVVLIIPEDELSSSSVVDDAVLEDTKKALSARSGSVKLKILRTPSTLW
ncbi:hypothetical protein PInf_012203 [Phytophthora infestans]|nr:hypothetical protein PInf_012203 [Phytophthora infestans]